MRDKKRSGGDRKVREEERETRRKEKKRWEIETKR